MNPKLLFSSLTNAALYLATCALIGTGLLLEFRLDEEDGAARIFGMGQDDWGEIHLVVALIFISLVVLHLVQKLAWFKMVLSRSKLALGLLLVGLIVIAGLLAWPATNTTAGESLRHILTDD
jgi:hypothetical protein